MTHERHDRHGPSLGAAGRSHRPDERVPHEHRSSAPGAERPSRSRPPRDHARDAHGDAGAHDKHAGHSVEMFRDRFWLTLAMTIPTLIWSHELQAWFRYTAPAFPGSVLIAPVFGTAVYVYGWRVFLQGAVHELRNRLPGMMTLIALAITVAFLFSLAVTLGYEGMALWWELSTLVTIMLLGHWIEMRSTFQAQGALKELARLLPNTAVRISDDTTEEVPIGELHEGDLMLIRPGAGIPADGLVQFGTTGDLRRVAARTRCPVDAGSPHSGAGGTGRRGGRGSERPRSRLAL
jgi:P-type Cu2+ transporter